jgi:hypothetical protein
MVYKRFKRVAKKAKRFYKKNRRTINAVGSVANTAMKALSMARTVYGVVNAEKMWYDISARDQVLGQFNGTSAGGGYYIADVTPIPAQGDTDTARMGDSIKICSAYIRFQFWDQSATSAPIRIRIQLFETIGQPQTVNSTLADKLLEGDAMLSGATIYDYNSSRHQDYFKNFKCIKTTLLTHKGDNYLAQTTITEKIIKLRFKSRHLKFQNNSTTITNGQMFVLITADNGNRSTTTATSGISGAPITAINTGLNFNYAYRWYYFDN